MPDNQPKPTVGRIVHYTLASGHVRPAIVVATWPDNDLLQLQVFVDGCNDGESRYGKSSGILPEEGKAGLAWRTSVHQAKTETGEPGCWHWPPRALHLPPQPRSAPSVPPVGPFVFCAPGLRGGLRGRRLMAPAERPKGRGSSSPCAALAGTTGPLFTAAHDATARGLLVFVRPSDPGGLRRRV